MTSPTQFLWRMLAVLAAVVGLAGLLAAEIATAFAANPMLNGETIRLDGAIRMGPK
jgi:hypothetical protein